MCVRRVKVEESGREVGERRGKLTPRQWRMNTSVVKRDNQRDPSTTAFLARSAFRPAVDRHPASIYVTPSLVFRQNHLISISNVCVCVQPTLNILYSIII